MKRTLNKKRLYIKEFTTIGKIKVWLVDGDYVRRNCDEEFTNFSQHYRFPFIPKNEFWIDRECAPGEELLFVDHLLVEYYMMKEGASYHHAISEADKWEQIERKKTQFAEKLAKARKKHDEKLMRLVHKKKLVSYSSPGTEVWIVSGEAVRDLFFIDFTCGGHEYVYTFVPKGEVWLDDDLHPKERKLVLLHELHERRLMREGWIYPKAHHEASKIEFFCRHFPKQLEKHLKQEKLLNR